MMGKENKGGDGVAEEWRVIALNTTETSQRNMTHEINNK